MKAISIITMIIMLGFVVCGIALVGLGIVDDITTKEVETYTVGMEIIEKDYSTYYVKNSGTRTNYILNVRGSGESFVEKVGEQTYAKYAVGDIVEVEVRVMESRTNEWKEYTILGFSEE